MATPWGAIIGGATNLIGSGLNFGSAKKNREMQIQLNRENNQFNAEQAQIQRDWQENMYNTYQSPSARRKQYEEAGFNPYLAMNGNSVGSVGSGSSASSAGTPNLQAPQLDVSSFANSMAQVAQAIKLSKEASNVDADHMMNRNFLAAGIQQALSQRDKNQGETNWFNRLMKDHNFTFLDKNAVRDYWRAYYTGEKDRIELANDVLGAEKVNLNLDARMKRISAAFLPKQVQQDLALKSAQISQTLSQVKLTKAQTASERDRNKLLIAQAAREYAAAADLVQSAVGRRLDNETQKQLSESYVAAALSNNDFLLTRNRVDSYNYGAIQSYVREALRYETELTRKRAENFILQILGSSAISAVGSLAGGALKAIPK